VTAFGSYRVLIIPWTVFAFRSDVPHVRVQICRTNFILIRTGRKISA